MKMKMKSYFISIWIRFDRAREFCSSDKAKRFYFVAYPHVISSNAPDVNNPREIINNGNEYFYENLITGNRVRISNLVNFNWNLITFHYNENNLTFKLIVNNDIEKPVFTSNVAQPTAYELRKILFCANNKNCKTLLEDYNLSDNFIWGSAYYRNLKIYDGVIENYINFQEKEQYLEDLNIIPDLHNLEYNIPFNLFNTEGGDILGVSPKKEKFDTTTELKYKKNNFYKNVDNLFHYSSKLDALESPSKTFFSARNPNGGNKFF